MHILWLHLVVTGINTISWQQTQAKSSCNFSKNFCWNMLNMYLYFSSAVKTQRNHTPVDHLLHIENFLPTVSCYRCPFLLIFLWSLQSDMLKLCISLMWLWNFPHLGHIMIKGNLQQLIWQHRGYKQKSGLVINSAQILRNPI